MTERSMFWDGTAGDGGPYDQSHLMDTFFARILGSQGEAGVLYNWLSDLEVTCESGISPVSVGSGGAVVYGMFYENDAPINITIPTPVEGDRFDRIVLRRDDDAQTIRIVRVAGTEGVAVAPSVGYGIPLAQIYITDVSGTITVTDEREYIAFATNWAEVPGIVTEETIQDNTIDFWNIQDRTRHEYKGAGQIVPDADNPCTWTSGQFDYWSFGSGDQCWVYFMVPVGYVDGSLEFSLYTAPLVAGAGDVEWNYSIYWGLTDEDGQLLQSHSSIITPAQGGRAIKTPNQDPLVWMQTDIQEGQIISLRIGRNIHGGLDTYAHNMALYGVEMEWTADA